MCTTTLVCSECINGSPSEGEQHNLHAVSALNELPSEVEQHNPHAVSALNELPFEVEQHNLRAATMFLLAVFPELFFEVFFCAVRAHV